jgi:hypothetical protein
MIYPVDFGFGLLHVHIRDLHTCVLGMEMHGVAFLHGRLWGIKQNQDKYWIFLCILREYTTVRDNVFNSRIRVTVFEELLK